MKREHYCHGEYCQVKTYWELSYDGMWSCNNCGRQEAYRVTQPRASRIPGFQTPSQKAAIYYIRQHIENGLDSKPERKDQITCFEAKTTDYGPIWLTVETEMLGLSKSNLLRFLSHDRWFFLIGRGGKIEAHSYPDSYQQFKGKRAFGFHIK